MSDADAVLVDWYTGEIGGEALFWGMAEAAEPERSRKWLALAEVESRVARRLAETLHARGRPIPECPEQPGIARARCVELAGKTWPEQMQWLKEIAVDALREMRVDAGTLPESLGPLGEFVLAHEIALVDFAQSELDGRGQVSLQPIREFVSRR